MKKLMVSAIATVSLLGGATAVEAQPPLVVGVDHPGDATLQQAQYVYLGHDYCWYGGGWHGPGFYWCGYAWRRGWGWGGPVGWRGWYSGPHYWRGGVWVGPHGYAHPEWGGWRGAHDWHGDQHRRHHHPPY